MKRIILVLSLLVAGCLQFDCPDQPILMKILNFAQLCKISDRDSDSSYIESLVKKHQETPVPVAEPEKPCAEQDPLAMSSQCVKEYLCPPAKGEMKFPVVGILFRGRVYGVVGLRNGSEFVKVNRNVLTGYDNVILLSNSSVAKVKWYVGYSNVEEDRCEFEYALEPAPSVQEEVAMLTTEKDPKINFAIDVPDKKNLELFRSKYVLCEDGKCNEQGGERSSNEVFAITDLNNNGNQEYWHIMTSEFQTFFYGDEFDESKGVWSNIFKF